MKTDYDMSNLEWRLTGWHPHYWRGTVSAESGIRLNPDVAAIEARVPGSVQQALRNADLLPDWNVKLNSRACEWVENRHWIFETVLPPKWTDQPGRKFLRCDGLDYQGVVLVNGHDAGAFRGTFTPHGFDLTDLLEPRKENRLSIVFTGVPEFLGQIGWTSRITEWKARFNYGWDWCPRLVQIGVWDALRLVVVDGSALDHLSMYAECNAREKCGHIVLTASISAEAGAAIQIAVSHGNSEVWRGEFAAASDFSARIGEFPVDLWTPNGVGQQPLYDVRVRLLAGDGQVLDEEARQVGFREVTWKPCANAPKDAPPFLCEVNGSPVFLFGFNWVPIRPFFADVTEAQYRHWLETYRNLGVNLLRVWGGAALEKECFYRLCDEMGIMVWQEFPLSSSGIDNWPPESPEAIAAMRRIVESYIRRRQHHSSLILWCGGNELQGGPDGSRQGTGRPVGSSHPMMAAQEALVRQFDPGRRFLPTSPSGPRFVADAAEFGNGVHYDVHGPWNHAGSLDDWLTYWAREDALFRSEVGMPGAAPADLVRKYGQEMSWPADKRANPWYGHCGGWWDQWREYLDDGGDPNSLEAYVDWSQDRQATALACVARRCRDRFPDIGGVLFWMGHDCYPCPINTAVIDFEGRPKPAALAIAGEVRRG